MKIKNIIFMILIVAFIGATVWLYIYQDHNDYVFKVNNEKVLVSEFDTYFNLQKKMMEAQYGENIWGVLLNDAPAIETARDSAKQSIVDTKIKLQQAQKRNLKLTEVEKQNIKTIVEVNGKDIMEQYGLTLDEMVKINEDAFLIEKLSIALFKETDHSSHLHSKVDIEKYESGEDYTGDEKTYNSRQILFDTREKSEEEKASIKVKAQEVLNRVKNGEDFAKLAGEYSDDPGSKDKGGLYENITLGSFVSEYENAAFSVKEGEIYPELVVSDYGFHIIKLEKINNPDAILGREATSKLLNDELTKQTEKWLAEANIEINSQQYDSFLTVDEKTNIEENDVSGNEDVTPQPEA